MNEKLNPGTILMIATWVVTLALVVVVLLR